MTTMAVRLSEEKGCTQEGFCSLMIVTRAPTDRKHLRELSLTTRENLSFTEIPRFLAKRFPLYLRALRPNLGSEPPNHQLEKAQLPVTLGLKLSQEVVHCS